MTNEEILANVPDGATHYKMLNGGFYSGKNKLKRDGSVLMESAVTSVLTLRAIPDIRRIVELEKCLADVEQAIIEQCAIYHSSCDLSDPRSTLKTLLDTNSKWSLDPRISSDASRFAIEQQINTLEKIKIELGYKRTWEDCHSKDHEEHIIEIEDVDKEIEKLRQQLNGVS